MQAKTAVLLGATGLTGNHLLQLLLADDRYEKVRAIVRKPLQQSHSKLEVKVIDFKNEQAFKEAIGSGDIIFCCIGTTMKNVKGDKTLYRQIDYDIAVNAAKYGSENGFTQYLLISAIGSNAGSSNFYVRLKGEVEHAIQTFPYRSIDIFRPSLLMGDRKEKRIAEKIFQGIMPVFSLLMIGGMQQYKPIHITLLAKAMCNAPFVNETGVHIEVYKDILKLANQQA
ncbi:MAG: NAD(P)H-binding protein [Chitinophagaceae bacterium]|nr:NAD(P)H-binding protein [Chitinophagaceae bacterium]